MFKEVHISALDALPAVFRILLQARVQLQRDIVEHDLDGEALGGGGRALDAVVVVVELDVEDGGVGDVDEVGEEVHGGEPEEELGDLEVVGRVQEVPQGVAGGVPVEHVLESGLEGR